MTDRDVIVAAKEEMEVSDAVLHIPVNKYAPCYPTQR